mgnify:CR=1 FL=1
MSVLKSNRTRRRFLKIVGIASIGVISGTTLVKLTKEDTLKKVTWSGIALGAPAEITIYHPNQKEAEDILSNSYKKLVQLESLFSLYNDDSQLSMLNKNGYVKNPDPDMIALLNLSKKYAEITDGAFDVTVQPLWNLYNEAFTKTNKPPKEDEIEKTLSLVDWRSITVSKNLINYEKKGMSSTLNGIAQGYITDKISEHLINSGINNTLVQLGEYRGIGDHPDGRPWRLLLSNPEHTDSIGEIEFTNGEIVLMEDGMLADGSKIQLGTDITRRKTREKILNQLQEAIEAAPLRISLFGNDDKLILANKFVREKFKDLGLELVPGETLDSDRRRFLAENENLNNYINEYYKK